MYQFSKYKKAKKYERQMCCFLFYVFIFIQLLPFNSLAQVSEFDRWAQLVNWDGVSSPESYIITSPKYMGPGALPVPYLREAKISDKIIFENAVEYYSQPGETTVNTFHQAQIPFADGKIALISYWRPLEYFTLDQKTLDERKILPQKGKGYAGGDLYFGTLVQLLTENNNGLPSANLGITFKTTTGKGLENARHINAPGYVFDVAIEKTIIEKENDFSLKAGTQLGFYVWQQKLNTQNDALLYGIKSSLTYKNTGLLLSYAGYNGWIDNGDKPIVARAEIQQKVKSIRYYFLYQYGIRDFIENGFRLGVQLSVSTKN